MDERDEGGAAGEVAGAGVEGAGGDGAAAAAVAAGGDEGIAVVENGAEGATVRPQVGDAPTVDDGTAEIRAAKKDGTAMPPQIATRQDLVNADKSSPRGGGNPGKPSTGGAKAVDTPEPSKRYTPKKPAPKRPTPPPAEPKPSRFRKLIGDDEPTTN